MQSRKTGGSGGRVQGAQAALTALVLVCAAGGAAGAERVRPPDSIAERVAACVACHGNEGRATAEGYFPRIAGKPAGYLFNQLANFRDGRRRNASMNYLVANLPDAYLQEIAVYFAAQNPPYPPPQAAQAAPAVIERGRVLTERGDGSKLPACAACHGSALTGVAPAIPGLLGLPRDYLNAQLGAWRNGDRRAHAPDCMGEIARRLSEADLGAVTAYLSTQAPAAHAAPAVQAPAPLPLRCGGLEALSVKAEAVPAKAEVPARAEALPAKAAAVPAKAAAVAAKAAP